MGFPQPRYPCHTSTPYGAAVTMPTPEPNIPMANFGATQHQQNAYPTANPPAYPQPPSQAYTPSYQPSYQQPSQPATPAYPPPPHTNNFLAVPMSPYPQTPSSTYSHYNYSRPGTPYSALSSTAVASEHSHDAGAGPGYRQSRAHSNPGSGPHCPEKPQPGTFPPQESSHGSGCCIIM